jgi:hypothetical protein
MVQERVWMRGFVITIISVALATILFTLSTTLHDNFSSMERAIRGPQPLAYASFLFDDVAYELTGITGTPTELRQENGSLEISTRCSVPNSNYTTELRAYENFIEGPLANKTNTAIEANFSNMTRGTLAMDISGYEYENRYDRGEMYFGGTGAQEYTINVSVFKSRGNITKMNSTAGDLNISLRYTDLAGSLVETVTIKSNETNVFRADYDDGGYIEIRAGRNRAEDGTILILTNNAEADVSWSAMLPAPAGRVGYAFDATMSYSQGGISKNSVIRK